MAKNSGTNLVFGILIVILIATAGVTIYSNRNRPEIREAAAALPNAGNLPEGHPPIDAANKVQGLEEMSRKDPNNPDLKVQVGNAYYDLGEFQKAIDAYGESLKLRPKDPGVETDMSTCYHYLHQTDRALEILNNVLQYNPTYPQALFNKGIVLLEGRKDAKGAVAAWEDLLRTNPDFPKKAEIEQRIRQLKSGSGF